MIKKVQPGTFLSSAWGADDYTEAANAINHASGGPGVRVGRNSEGGLKVDLGDDNLQLRDITICEPTTTGDGRSALAFKRVKVLCTNPSEPFAIVPVPDANGVAGGDTDCCRPIFSEGGVMTQILFGKASAFQAFDATSDESGITTVDVVEASILGVE